MKLTNSERAQKWAKENPERVKQNNQLWAKENRTYLRAYHAEWRAKNPDKVKAQSKKRLKPIKKERLGYKPKECSICKTIFKPVTSRHLTCSLECTIVLKRKRKNIFQKRYHKVRKNIPNYILMRVLRTCLGNIVKQKCYKSHRYCSFSSEEFRLHIETKFKSGMSWENWGEWHIDHIKPLSKFKLVNDDESENLENILKANSLDNLQPLWATDNLRKHAKWSDQ